MQVNTVRKCTVLCRNPAVARFYFTDTSVTAAEFNFAVGCMYIQIFAPCVRDNDSCVVRDKRSVFYGVDIFYSNPCVVCRNGNISAERFRYFKSNAAVCAEQAEPVE
jgi:hypothetical protein